MDHKARPVGPLSHSQQPNQPKTLINSLALSDQNSDLVRQVLPRKKK